MIRLAIVAVLLASVPQDDPMTQKVRALVEQLKSDDVQTADDAVADLVKLGEAGLAAIRAEAKKATGDTKLKLEAAAAEIDKVARRSKAMGKALLVSVKADAKPVADVLQDLKTVSGQPITCKNLPATKVSVALADAPFWTALDEICKAGNVMWRVKGEEIVVDAKPYRAVPKICKGNLVFYLDNLSATTYLQNGGGSNVMLDGALAWVKGARPLSSTMSLEQLEDDKGTKLISADQGGVIFMMDEDYEDGAAPSANRLSDPLRYNDRVAPHDDAEKLTICKGTVTVKYALDYKKVLTLQKPADAKGQTHQAGDFTVAIQEYSMEGRVVRMLVAVTMRGEMDELPIHARDFAITDKEGKSYPASGHSEDWESSTGQGGTTTTVTYALTVRLPEKVEVASFDFIQPTEVEEIVIPFEFKDLPIK